MKKKPVNKTIHLGGFDGILVVDKDKKKKKFQLKFLTYMYVKSPLIMLKEIIAKLKSCTCNKSSSNDINALKESEESKTKQILTLFFNILIQLDKILENSNQIMGIKTVSDYVKFYVGLNMQNSISLSSFAYNEKLVMTNKLENSSLKKEQIIQGLQILDELLAEIRKIGEQAVLKKYVK